MKSSSPDFILKNGTVTDGTGSTPIPNAAVVILAGTRNAAQVCGLNTHGTLEPGHVADILVVDGNPLDDLDSLRRSYLVIHNGERIR